MTNTEEKLMTFNQFLKQCFAACQEDGCVEMGTTFLSWKTEFKNDFKEEYSKYLNENKRMFKKEKSEKVHPWRKYKKKVLNNADDEIVFSNENLVDEKEGHLKDDRGIMNYSKQDVKEELGLMESFNTHQRMFNDEETANYEI